MRNIILSAAALICAGTLGAQQANVRVHDPVMIKEGDTYYVFHTGNGVSVKKSKDMIQWDDAPSVFDKDKLPTWHKTDIPEQKGHLWAPDIYFRDGKYHLYYSVSAWMNFNSSIGYATNTTLDASSPNYKWVDQGKVIDYRNGGEGVNVIDPNVFVDKKTGKIWLLYGSYKSGLRMVELDSASGKLKSEKPELVTLTTSLGEGVFLVEHGGYYYIFASRGKCCAGNDSNYQIVIGRSKYIEGPYETKSGESWLDNSYTVFLAGDYDEPGRGHNGFFTEDDTTYIVYHAYTRAAGGASLLNIKPIYIGQDGWLTIENTGKIAKTHHSNNE